jgi:hypothetical protein
MGMSFHGYPNLYLYQPLPLITGMDTGCSEKTQGLPRPYTNDNSQSEGTSRVVKEEIAGKGEGSHTWLPKKKRRVATT